MARAKAFQKHAVPAPVLSLILLVERTVITPRPHILTSALREIVRRLKLLKDQTADPPPVLVVVVVAVRLEMEGSAAKTQGLSYVSLAYGTLSYVSVALRAAPY